MNLLATEAPIEVRDKASLSADELRKINAYWCACNYLDLGMLGITRSCENLSRWSISKSVWWAIGDPTLIRVLSGST